MTTVFVPQEALIFLWLFYQELTGSQQLFVPPLCLVPPSQHGAKPPLYAFEYKFKNFGIMSEASKLKTLQYRRSKYVCDHVGLHNHTAEKPHVLLS